MSYLQAGFARLDITPPLDVQMAGYFFERRAKGVLDPLYVNALAVQNGENRAVILSCDLIKTLSGWTEIVARAAGLRPEQVFLHSIHTHTGPLFDAGRCDEMYNAWLLRRLGDAAVMALRDCKPVTELRAYEGICTGVAFTRRFKMKDGRYQTWARYLDPDIETVANEPDESLRLIRILREGGEELALVNFASHPDTVSGDLYSADFPAFLRERVESARPGVKCVFFNGTEGELVSADWLHDSLPREHYVRTRYIGLRLGDFVVDHYDEAVPIPLGDVSFGTVAPVCPTKRDPSYMPEALRIIAIRDAGREEEELGPDWIATPLVAEALVQRRLDELKLDELEIPVSVVAFGGIAMAGFAGEPFSEIGVQVRKASPYAVTFTCCNVNGWEGYYPTAEAYDQGGYEPANTRLAKGVGEQLTEECIALLQRI